MDFDTYCRRNDLQAHLQWHPVRNNGLLPSDVPAHSNQKAWWICPKGHEWHAIISQRARGAGCPVCAGKMVWKGENDLATLHPELVGEWHPEKNQDLQPDQVTSRSGRKVWWICEKGHEWQAVIASRSKGHGCPCCAGNQVIPGETDLATMAPQLALEWHPTLNGALSPGTIAARSSKRIWWQCRDRHVWQAKVSSRFFGNGCPYCSGRRVIPEKTDLATMFPEIAETWCTEMNQDLFPNMVTTDSGRRVWWQCGRGHRWQSAIVNRTQGHGCPYCANQKVQSGENDLASQFPFLAKQWHPVKNEELLPPDVVAGSKRKVWWQCERGHEWQAAIGRRVAGHGCPYCSNQKVQKGENDLASQLPSLAKQWHPVKNKGLLPSDVVVGSQRKVWWLCDKAHEWQAAINSRVRGNGCPYCSGRRAISGITDLATVDPVLSQQWHPTKNLYLSPADVPAGSVKKVWWLCDKAHEWQATINSRVRGNGCPYCAGKAVWRGYNDLHTVSPLFARQWHPEKNKGLTPYEITIGSGRPVWWRCEKGHEWKASPNARRDHSGCPVCNIESHTSFPEQALFFYVKQFFEAYNRHLVGNKEIDIYIPMYSIGIEHDGPFHDFQEVRERDRKKELALGALGIRLIRVKTAERFHVDENSWTIYYPYCQTDRTGVETAIRAVLTLLSEETGHDCTTDIDVNRDEDAIYRQYMDLERENGLFFRVPEAQKYWSEKNTVNPQFISPGSHRKTWWRCEEGHEWQTTVHSFSNGSRCPVCAGRKVLKGYNDLETRAPALSKEWHPAKNLNLTPDMLTTGSGKKVWWQCEKGHVWQARVVDRFNGASGCPYCSGRQAIPGINDLATLDQTLAAQWHPEKNGELKASEVMRGSSKRVWWQCTEGHEWQTSVHNRSKGHGCPYCAGQRAIKGENDLATVCQALAAQWHPQKTGT